ncbi:CLK4-associating serine arginine rich isoform X2 [Chlorella sorokiniana]|uniref:CLK4-associating serine arginine rich isoform X2 n=1 Tax=Chlorella sorokiniana TaxID=3076 RepID=A0A2P6TL46_CHLSO|nr:CLK4-associating serine arginine rich isoform X2 [Chlorella sorokiniana]|eukprot:PRW45018.1 CLK4-associating serine arginine rich isoform X2 [Chlorella sorokiniana]
MAGLKSFKGALSQLYGEQRAQVKGIKERSLVNKAKNEAKRELEEAQSDQPIHFLRIDGRAARLVKNDAQFYAQQQNEGLVPWGAQPDVLIDRYDVRSLLDMYVAPDPRVLAHRQRTAKELELEEQLRFEAYRDLVRLKCLGLSERQGIAHAEQENVAIRAASRAAAVAALEAAKGPKPLPSQSALFAGSGASATPAGTGQFAAVGFSYGGSEGGGGDEEEEEEEEEESDDDDVPATAEDADMDRSALKEFGLEDFSSMLRWAMRQEAEEAAAVRRRRRYTGWGRKKASIRAKRLVGQGLNPTEFAKRPPAHYGGAAALQPNDISWIPEKKAEDLAQMFDRRGSPEYEGGRRRSRSPGSRRPQTEFITSFGGAGDQAPGQGQGPRQQQQQQEEGPTVRDAVPGGADPALEGPHMLPAAAIKLHGVRPEERGRDRYGGSISGRDYSKAKAAAAAPKVVRAVDKSKETPQERLKRLMAAQLNKKIQSDTITAAQKKQQEDSERRARMANEAAAQEAERRDRDRERARRRSRSRSPRSERRRGERSRSRERRRGERSRSRERERDSRRRSRSRSRSRDRQHRRRSPSPYRGYRR